MSRATGLSDLTLRLTRARFATRQGESLLYFAAIFATTISAALALTVAAGTMMFYNRWRQPPDEFAAIITQDPTFDVVLMFYFVLALVATALLIPAMVSLSASAAVLGARGRERRLAALRLLGLSSSDVTRMSLIDSTIQATIGTILGSLIYVLTAPLWRVLEFQNLPTALHLPWWLALAVMALNIVIALLATWWGLRQVRISPLGVARRGVGPKLTAARVVIFVGALGGFAIFGNVMHLGRGTLSYLIMAAAIAAVVAGYNLFGPWLLQIGAKLYGHLPGPAALLASRRIMADPRAIWRRVGGLGFIGLVAGYLGTMPFEMNGNADPLVTDFAAATQWDFTKGAIVTLAVVLTLTATAIMISQASAVFERADLTIALHRIGTPAGFHVRVQWLENLGPLVVVTGIGFGLGVAMGLPMLNLAKRLGAEHSNTGMIVVGCVILAGFGLTALALLATQPLHAQVLGTQRRRND